MRRIKLHRRATKYLRRMPRDRQAQMISSLEDVAALDDISTHPNIRSRSGADGWFRLRVGGYRAILQPWDGTILYVDYISTRGSAY